MIITKKMMCNHLRYKISSVIFILCFCQIAFSETIKDEFKDNKSNIAEQGWSIGDNYYYSRGEAIPISQSTISVSMSKRKAEVSAKVGLSRIIFSKIIWPDSISPKLKELCKKQYLLLNTIKFTTAKGIILSTSFVNEKMVVIYAVPKEKLKLKFVTYKSLIESFKKAFNFNDNKLDLTIFYELCPNTELTTVKTKLLNQWERDYGINVRLMLEHKYCKSFDLKKAVNTLSNIDQLDKVSLLKLLSNCPYLTEAIACLQKKFLLVGKKKTAKLFSSLLMGESEKNIIVVKELAQKAIMPDNISTLHKPNTYGFSREALFILQNQGKLPIKASSEAKSKYFKIGKKYFSSWKPDIDKALTNFIKALSEEFNPDVCNMIGCCLKLKNKPKIAIPFLAQAMYMNRKHKYAMINLAICLKMAKYNKTALVYAQQSLSQCELDFWGREKAKNIIKRLK